MNPNVLESRMLRIQPPTVTFLSRYSSLFLNNSRIVVSSIPKNSFNLNNGCFSHYTTACPCRKQKITASMMIHHLDLSVNHLGKLFKTIKEKAYRMKN